MKDVGLITLHGMGKIKTSYYSELEEILKKKLGIDWTRVSFQNVQYAPEFQEPQDELWRDIIKNTNNDLDATKLRQFFLFGFGDAGSLEHSAHKNGVKYLAVQKEIQKAIDHIYLDFEGDISKPIIIIAQSLGCQVISNYLWDAQHDGHIFENSNTSDQNKADFRRLVSLENLITTGCNIPLFVSGLENRQCFDKPNDKFIWDNYYDPDDILGWPLKQLGDTYNIVNDHHINAGGLFSSWNPASHGAYWSDSDVTSPLANILKSKF